MTDEDFYLPQLYPTIEYSHACTVNVHDTIIHVHVVQTVQCTCILKAVHLLMTVRVCYI